MSEFSGYHGRAAESLGRWGAAVGDRITIRSGDITYAGIVMPRYHHQRELFPYPPW